MKIHHGLCLIVMLMFASPAAAGEGVTKATIDSYRQTKEAVEKLTDTKAGKYARDIIENTKASVFKAQQAIESGDEKAAKQAIEMANLQITLAGATADEREATDKTAVSRTELKQLEQRLENILAGKGDAK
jgi:mannitol-1-phosphate/altronate dehydrogenase